MMGDRGGDGVEGENENENDEIFQAADFVNKDKLRLMYKLLNNALCNLAPEEYGGLKVKLYKNHIKIFLEN